MTKSPKNKYDFRILSSAVMNELLVDRTTGNNIIWATDDYADYGEQYSFVSPITLKLISADTGIVIQPRVEKDKESQSQRSKDKAEVFTPSWVCNAQNNIIDDAWFGKHSNRFNKETEKTWESTYPRKDPNDTRDRIKFPNKPGKTWKDYVLADRLEVSCGEAPYLTSRYDTVTGKYIKTKNRIGLLDRKLRVISENTPNAAVWLNWAEKALQSTYGFEWQGDNLLLARKNILLAVMEYYYEQFNSVIKEERLIKFAQIISWNLWQMDGIKFVIPNTCHIEKVEVSQISFEDAGAVVYECHECPGCKSGNKKEHNGIYATIMDWKESKIIRFVDMMEGEKHNG